MANVQRERQFQEGNEQVELPPYEKIFTYPCTDGVQRQDLSTKITINTEGEITYEIWGQPMEETFTGESQLQEK